MHDEPECFKAEVHELICVIGNAIRTYQDKNNADLNDAANYALSLCVSMLASTIGNVWNHSGEKADVIEILDTCYNKIKQRFITDGLVNDKLQH